MPLVSNLGIGNLNGNSGRLCAILYIAVRSGEFGLELSSEYREVVEILYSLCFLATRAYLASAYTSMDSSPCGNIH